jgi:hypothetical protein
MISLAQLKSLSFLGLFNLYKLSHSKKYCVLNFKYDFPQSDNCYASRERSPMINKRYRRYIQSFLLVLPMTGIVTAVNTVVAKGPSQVLTAPTLHRWGISVIVAFPAVLLIAPLAIKITDRLTKSD